MDQAASYEHIERRFLPAVARIFATEGFERATLRRVAEVCQTSMRDIKALWPTRAALFVAALEYAYECAERVWRSLLTPRAAAPDAHVAAFARGCGDDFRLAQLLAVGNDAIARPQVRKTMRRLNRRLARFLADQVTQLHVDALDQDDNPALRMQAAAALRQLAQAQRDIDEHVRAQREALLMSLRGEIVAAAAKRPTPTPHA